MFKQIRPIFKNWS